MYSQITYGKLTYLLLSKYSLSINLRDGEELINDVGVLETLCSVHM